MSRIAAVCLIACLGASNSLAQGVRSKFSTELSVKELHIETGPLGDPARSCGLTAADLERPAQAALEAARLRIIQTASDFIFVNANVITIGDACTAAIDVELFRNSNEFRTAVSVWSHEALITGPRAGFNVRVREKVDALTKEFVADWEKARR